MIKKNEIRKNEEPVTTNYVAGSFIIQYFFVTPISPGKLFFNKMKIKKGIFSFDVEFL